MPDKTHYLTKQGLRKLRKEREELRKKRKDKKDEGVPDVLHSEDLNPEFQNFREEMYFIEKRLSELEEIIENAEIIEPPEDKNTVQLGAKITVEADGKEDEFRIVGPREADPAKGKISNESPVGKALIGKKKGEEVAVSSPVETIYKVKKIEY